MSRRESEILATFSKLTTIPSPSGHERAILEYIKARLEREGIGAYFDNADRHNESDAGNLIAKLSGSGSTVLFVAHADTVGSGKVPVHPVVRRGVVTTDGSSVLGADNKAAVAVLIEVLEELKTHARRPTVICVFSTMEEKGAMGVKYLGLKEHVDYAFDLDGEGRPGAFVNRSLGYMPFTIMIKGKEAHAGHEPEKGRNALKAAGLIIANARLGKDSSGTVNIGTVSSGSALNIVPGSAELRGEIRAFTREGMRKKMTMIEQAARAACGRTGCRYKILNIKKENDAPFHTTDNRIISLARRAASEAGLKFSLRSLYATCQASNLAEKGYNVLGVCRGGSMPHTTQESITIGELASVRRLVLSICRIAGQGKAP